MKRLTPYEVGFLSMFITTLISLTIIAVVEILYGGK